MENNFNNNTTKRNEFNPIESFKNSQTRLANVVFALAKQLGYEGADKIESITDQKDFDGAVINFYRLMAKDGLFNNLPKRNEMNFAGKNTNNFDYDSEKTLKDIFKKYK